MNEVWIVNASRLISLAKIGQIKLLEQLAHRLIVPDAVAAEILAGSSDDLCRIQLAAGWGERGSPTNVSAEVIEWNLGSGETAVIALSLQMRPSVAVLDDRAARTAARAMGIPVLGTLGILLRAKRKALIPAVAPLVADLQAAGLYLDVVTLQLALSQIGEKWPIGSDLSSN